MKKIVLITGLLLASYFVKSQTYTSDRTIMYKSKKVDSEEFQKVEIDIDEKNKTIYVSWLDINQQWVMTIDKKREQTDSWGYYCTNPGGTQNVLTYTKSTNEFALLIVEEDLAFIFQHIKKKE